MHHLLAHSGLLKVSQTCNDPAGIQPQTGSGAVGGQCVGHIVTAHGGDLYEESALLVILQHKAHALFILLDGQSTDISVLIAQAEPDRADMVGQNGLAQEGIIPVQHQRSTLRQTGADLQLCLADVLLTAQVADVGHPDAGDDAYIRAGALAQALDLSGVAHSHLHHGVLGLFADAEHGAGQAQLIVLVALGLDGTAKACNGGVGHLLCGGLAHAAGHAHHFGVELAAVVGTQHHHGVVAVRADHALLLRHAFHGVVQHHAERAVFQRLGGKIMAVEFFARERHKDAPGADLTAVGGHQRDRGLALGQRVDG